MNLSSLHSLANRGEPVLFMLNGFVTAQGRELRAGDAVVVVRTGERGWMLVRDSKGQKSWVPQSYVQPAFHERQEDVHVLNSLQVESEIEFHEHKAEEAKQVPLVPSPDPGGPLYPNAQLTSSRRQGDREREHERALESGWIDVQGSVAVVEQTLERVEISLLRMQKMHEEELNALLSRFEGKIASLEDVADTRLVVEVEAELRRERKMHEMELKRMSSEVAGLQDERSRLLRRIEGMETERMTSELAHRKSQDSVSSASRLHWNSRPNLAREPSERIRTLEKNISDMMRSLEEKDQEIRLLSQSEGQQNVKMSEEKLFFDFEQMKKSNADLNMLVQGYKEKVKKMEQMLEDERNKSQVESSNFGLRSVLELEVENTALKQLLRENEEQRGEGDEEEIKKLREANVSLQETLANLQEEFMGLRQQHEALLASSPLNGRTRLPDLGSGPRRSSEGESEGKLKVERGEGRGELGIKMHRKGGDDFEWRKMTKI